MTELARDHRVVDVATRLSEAARTGRPTPPVRDVLGATDIDSAYRVQSELTRARLAAGARIVGRKIGLTSPAVQQQLGVDQPDSGVLFHDMAVADGAEIDSSRLIQPKAEAEIAFVLGRAPDIGLAPDPAALITAADRLAVAEAVDYAVAALEIVDSRITDWDISITDTVADNASSGLFVLSDHRVPLTDFAPVEVSMVLNKDGQRASSGEGSACLGDPLNALVWLSRTAAVYGQPLRAGDIVLSGALGPMVAVEPGSQVTAELSVLGSVSVSFSSRQVLK